MTSQQYSEQIQRAKQMLSEGYYVDSVKICGSTLEHFLKNLYNEVKSKVDDYTKDKFFEFEENQKINIDCYDVEKFTLGQMTYTFRNHNLRLFELIKEYLNIDSKITKTVNFKLFNEIRNKCIHPNPNKNTFISPLEAKFIFYSTRLIFEEFGHFKENICPSCKKEVGADQTFCQYCSNPISRICFNCGTKLEDVWNNCPKCSTRADLESRIKDIENLLYDAIDKREHCPICRKDILRIAYKPNSEENVIQEEYHYDCNCMSQIQCIILARSINIDISSEVKTFINSEIYSDKLVNYLMEKNNLQSNRDDKLNNVQPNMPSAI